MKVPLCLYLLILSLLCQAQEENTQEVTLFVSYESLPEFPGGQKGFQKFLKETTQLPLSNHKSTNVRIYLSFVVDEKGKLSEIEVIRGAAEKYNQEAIRIMKASPPWIPGKIRGKPLKTRVGLRINFQEESVN